ncbi:MAG TPA: transposase [Candidatus Avalokitesvara rifleensis]|uniref:transposase n=1 Tax=Candidatus Avalokitesvara rifleensis TaxID=3367620 RepID=UPI002713A635|nr:transposase [Candidatus Brocadiales bacterium]
MGTPKRYNIEGHVHFVTTTCYKRVPIFLYDLCNTSVIEAVEFYRRKHNFNLIGYTIMPDHLHLLIQLHNATKISDIIRDVKHAVAFKILGTLKAGQQAPPYPNSKTNKHKVKLHTTESADGASRTNGLSRGKAGLLALPSNNNILARPRLENPGKRGHRYSIWERGFYDFNIYSEKMLKEKLDYIHMNPVRRGLVGSLGDWRYSSFRNYFSDNHSVITVDKIEL